MSRTVTSRVKLNPALGRMPTLQFCRPSELRIDPTYQRDVSGGGSQVLIRRIAQHWNWDLCQPLVVARRVDFTERLFVIDGQHRLEAARLRGDIDQLPCVIVNYTSAADEAASFVNLNQQRRRLSKIDLFKAALTSDDTHATAIAEAICDAGLTIAPHENCKSWAPGMIANIGGIEQIWERHGEQVAKRALRVMADAFQGQVLRYAGTIFPGIARIVADEIDRGAGAEARFERMGTMLAMRNQDKWRNAVLTAKADRPDMNMARAAGEAFRMHWGLANGEKAAPKQPLPFKQHLPIPARAEAKPQTIWTDGRAWCGQCERRVSPDVARACVSRFCKVQGAT